MATQERLPVRNGKETSNIEGFDFLEWLGIQIRANVRPDLIEPAHVNSIKNENVRESVRNIKNTELVTYIKNILVFTPENYKYLKSQLEPEEFEKVCISLIGGKSYNIFKMQDAGIECPLTVPLTTNFYFEVIGYEIQELVADIFQTCGGEDNIHYPHYNYKPEFFQSIETLLKEKIRSKFTDGTLSPKAEATIRMAYDLLGGFKLKIGKIVRSAKVAEDSPNASFAGCGDSNAQFKQETEEEDFALFRFNIIEVVASAFNYTGIENMLRMTDENGSNFNPKKDPMAETLMPFVYPENYAQMSDEQLVNSVAAAYIFHNQLGFDGRAKINIQITNGTGATIADSCAGLPLVTVDKLVHSNPSEYTIDLKNPTRLDVDTLIYYATDTKGKKVEFIRIFTPEQKTCFLINEKYDYKNPKSSRKKEAKIPENSYKPALDLNLIFKLIGDKFVGKINQIYPEKDMESEYAIIIDPNSGEVIDTKCVQTRPITAHENKLIGEIPKPSNEILPYIKYCEAYSVGAAVGIAYCGGKLPNNTTSEDKLIFCNTKISQDDAPEYTKKGVNSFAEEEITGKYTHGAVQSREMRIPCVSGVGNFIQEGKTYLVFAYANSLGKGMLVECNEETKGYVEELLRFHQVQVENAFNIKENLEAKPLKYFKAGVNVSSADNARKYGKNGLGIRNCPLFRPNVYLSAKFKGFDYINPERDPNFENLRNGLTNEVYEAAIEFDVFNYRHCGPQGSEMFANTHPKMEKLYREYGNDKFSAIQGATLTNEHPNFFTKVEIPMIKSVLERLKKEGKKVKLKFTIEYPKSAEEVDFMLREMEKAGLHEYENLWVGPMIENVHMALDLQNISFGKFKDRIAISIASNDLGTSVLPIDRQKVGGLETVEEANSNPNPTLQIIQIALKTAKELFPNASLSICGEIVSTLKPYVAPILFNMGITEYAMPTDPVKFGEVYTDMLMYEKRYNPETRKIDMPETVRVNPLNSELQEVIQQQRELKNQKSLELVK